MKRIKSSFILMAALLFFSCTTSNKISYWKTPIIYPRGHNKIMVVSIVQDTSLRRQMEEHLVGDLLDLGYNAVSALDQFGVNGLHRLSQEQTYATLCNKGIDAVITIVLVDESKEKAYKVSRFKTNASTYYFNRIWNYYKIQTNQLYITNNKVNSNFFYESVFFDLTSLEPLYAVRTKSFVPSSAEALAHEYGKMIIKSMAKNKILSKQDKPVVKPVKPF